MQQEVTDVTAEAAFASYLEKLNEVARLEVVALHQEEEAGGRPEETIANGMLKPNLHVVARTPGEAPRYFYRKRMPWATWTAWEPALLQIEGDHLVVAMWRGRPHLFWLTFRPGQEETEEILLPTETQPLKAAPKYEEVRLSWSELKPDGSWTPAATSSALLRLEGAKRDYALKLDDVQPWFSMPEERDKALFIRILQRGFWVYGNVFVFAGRSQQIRTIPQRDEHSKVISPPAGMSFEANSSWKTPFADAT